MNMSPGGSLGTDTQRVICVGPVFFTHPFSKVRANRVFVFFFQNLKTVHIGCCVFCETHSTTRCVSPWRLLRLHSAVHTVINTKPVTDSGTTTEQETGPIATPKWHRLHSNFQSVATAAQVVWADESALDTQDDRSFASSPLLADLWSIFNSASRDSADAGAQEEPPLKIHEF